ncbi:MAG: hypothetical protein M1838_000344 [Thelocarpon superellum]|nr:MAG: hypothetical protein M1838_000344 [Thelocarpon superellum]
MSPSRPRFFSRAARLRAEDEATSAPAASEPARPSRLQDLLSPKVSSRARSDPATSNLNRDKFPGGLNNLARFLENSQTSRPGGGSAPPSSFLDYDLSASNPYHAMRAQHQPPHRFHIYATKHNTHITLAKPDGNAIISVAAGNLGFRKSARGSYDAAYQLAAYVMNRIQEQGLLREILKLELVLRGFGVGREAVTKALLGTEGRNLRGRVIRVTDSTRLKFGGTRSKKPRRLG